MSQTATTDKPRPITSKWKLLNALATGGPLEVAELQVVNQVQREDGSNQKWNVTGIGFGTKGTKTVFVMTLD